MDIERARNEVAYFARVLVGEELWQHQLELAEHPARIRVACSGRQAGKSRTLAVCALHTAFQAPLKRILLVSAGEQASKDLLAECIRLSSSPLLAGSKVDETNSQLVLSNGSTIRSVPASERQIRGQSVDLLVIDEGAFVDEAIWSAARWTVIARAGSRVIVTSTPYGRLDAWFACLYRNGVNGVPDHASFHWPSQASPLVDKVLLDTWRQTSTDREYRAEVLAEFVADEGSFFPAELIESCIEDYDLVPPAEANGMPGAGGCDWGKRIDASALAIVAGHPDKPGALWVPWIAERFKMPYSAFIDTVVIPAAKGYSLTGLTVELNGVGDGVVEILEERLAKARLRTPVTGVHTSIRSKEAGYGEILLGFEAGMIWIPRHPELMQQLHATEFVVTEAGNTTISVPERLGHDDIVDALSFAVPAARQQLAAAAKRKRMLDRGPGGVSGPSNWGPAPGGGMGGGNIPPPPDPWGSDGSWRG